MLGSRRARTLTGAFAPPFKRENTYVLAAPAMVDFVIMLHDLQPFCYADAPGGPETPFTASQRSPRLSPIAPEFLRRTRVNREALF